MESEKKVGEQILSLEALKMSHVNQHPHIYNNWHGAVMRTVVRVAHIQHSVIQLLVTGHNQQNDFFQLL